MGGLRKDGFRQKRHTRALCYHCLTSMFDLAYLVSAQDATLCGLVLGYFLTSAVCQVWHM